ncbi:hypothetical protein Q5P01_012459 [Channa striata]|uniref:non-specific serine/threonine protein kinase n=1 Tax=Channa striata TaxID=64152 RepID=A0AA88SR60_CHASR|nr:hypothetical protein Q5P01_012459 [Channa striata]
MTSRRPMTRSFSSNGRTSSFSEEEGSSSNGRSESRNPYLSSVRPENRSTLCSIMAQLTEDIQPSFETTLKSKAVSENCNVKFTCVVSGYPAPELKWYKDDMEMDRYCGLPKYEIHRNGKTHTLIIYNCTLDDAAIYQASASNSKGIVSCSGVLEVGIMNEYKIHQRFFAKLKQKADKKKKELEEQTKKEDKENIQKDQLPSSPGRPQRKRHAPPLLERPVVKQPEVVEQVGAAAEPNGFSFEVKENGPEDEIPPPEEALAKKQRKFSNGVDAGINSSIGNRSHMMENGGENCYDGGISLKQFLAETLQSQATEEKHNLSQVEKPKEVDMNIVNASIEKDREKERMQKEVEKQEKALEEERKERREMDLSITREEKESSSEMLHTSAHSKHGSEVKPHSKAHKDHDHHNIQTSISSMLHSVKDFLFGKSKKDSCDHVDNKKREFDHASKQPSQPETPPSFCLQPQHNPDVYKPLTEDLAPMETDKAKESSGCEDIEQQSVEMQEHRHDDSVLHIDLPPAHKLPPASTVESMGQCVRETGVAMEAVEVSMMAGGSSPEEEKPMSKHQVLNEMEDKDSPVVSVTKEVPVNWQEPDCLLASPHPNHQSTRDESIPRQDIPVFPQTQAPFEEDFPTTSSLTSLEKCWTLPHNVISESHSLGEVPTETLQEEMSVDTISKEGKPETAKGPSYNKLYEEEKVEVKSNRQPCSDINRSEITELTTSSLEERIEPYESKTQDQVLSHLTAVASYSAKGENAKEASKCTSLIQEMNVGFPPTATSETFERGDLKIQSESAPYVLEESTGAYTLNAIQVSNLGFNNSEKGSDLKEVLNFVEEEDRKPEEHTILEGESGGVKNDRLQFDVETEKKVEELDESKILSVSQNEGYNVNVLEKHSNSAYQDSSENELGWPLKNIPQIQITTEDAPDITPTVPDGNQNECFIIPKTEIMEPEFKECSLPLTILALNKPESEPTIVQKHDVTHVSEMIVQDQNMANSQGLLPIQKTMQNDFNYSLTEKVKEVAQLDDKTEMIEHEKQQVKSSEELPQMDCALIPVINVSCTDDKDVELVDDHVSHTQQLHETPAVSCFVVPPISVTCHENNPGFRLPTHSEHTETKILSVTQRGTRRDVGTNMATKPEKTQSTKQIEEMAEKLNSDTSSLLYEALLPKVGNGGQLISKTTEDDVAEIFKIKPLKEIKIDNCMSFDDTQRNKPTVERLSCKPPAHPSLSPASLRKFMSKTSADNEAVKAGPVITVGDHQSDKADEDISGGSTPTSSLSCESSPRLKRRDSLSLIRSATPEELASGARRKIFIPKTKEDGEGAAGALDTQVKKEAPYMSPSQARRAALLQASPGQNTPPMERRSPLLSRKKATLEVPKVMEEAPKDELVSTKREEKPAEKKPDPLKAPQVIRKIRGEPFADASGHLKLWCQFFNVLSDSTIKWYRDEEEILEVKRSGGDESQVALAIVLASSQDCGVYGCTINNEYGTDTTDFLLSVDILSEILLKDDLEVGEEIEMTPLLFSKGLADCGNWGDKYFGRIMTEKVHVGEGCAHKASRVKVIYGLDPIFESGRTSIIKVKNPIAYGTKQDSILAERNLLITKQECKVQNMIREYCKIFAAEARVIENFGHSLEVIPKYLMYRPANSVPYATVEADLEGVFLKYCIMDPKGKLITHTASEVEQKVSTFQHWIHQWTHGNLLVTQLEGVEAKLTNVKVVTKSKGYQGLTESGSPEIFEQFLTHHQCNYYCGLLGLRPLKSMESLQQPSKIKGSRSPLLNRKLGSNSPQMSRKPNCSPKATRKVQETEDNKSDTKPKPTETVDALEIR